MSPDELLKEAKAKGIGKIVVTDINSTTAILDIHRLSLHFSVQPIAGIDFRNGAEQKFIGISKNHQGFFELNTLLTKCIYDGEKGLTTRVARIPDRAPELDNAFIIYPFSSLPIDSHIEAPLRANEFIGIKPADLNRLRFSPWRYQSEKLVVLSPVTFRSKIEFNVHRLLRAMDNNTLLSKLPVTEQAASDEIMLGETELLRLYADFPEIIYNTRKLLDECQVIDFEFGKNKNKKTFSGSARGDKELLIKLCEDSLEYRYPKKEKHVIERFNYEIKLITELGFASYFLINWDIVRYASSRGFFYVGRGSGANSMVAYLLRITDVDPIELDLYFERFINAFRTSPPDFDIDFSWKDRDEITDYIFKRNLSEKTALLGAYSTFKADAVVRELGKVFGLPKGEIDALQDPLRYPPSKDDITKLIYQYARLLQNFPNYLTIHATGILISEKPITYYSALANPPKGFPLVQFSMLEAEDVGFAKFDILSQRGLGHIKDAVEIIKANKGKAIDIHDIKRFKNDKNIEKNLTEAKLMGCFYVESPAMRMLLTKLKAKTYLDLVAASSIIRPGVAQSGMMQQYIKRFHDPEHGKKDAIPQLWDLMPDTFGVMVYQEDVIKVAHNFADLTLGEADMLRRGMNGKYTGRAEFTKVKETFFTNCKKKGYADSLTAEVWREMESFGGYAFAKGHSASFAVESYQSMFLKTYYPKEFMVGVINNHGGFFSSEFYIHELRMAGGIIHTPDVNHSEVQTSINGDDVYLGFELMKDFEQSYQEKIWEERKRNGVFMSLENFMKRISISVDQLRILIRVGAFSFTGRRKHQLLWDIHAILGSNKKTVAGPELFDDGYKKYSLPKVDEDIFRDATDEMEILGFPLCSPFELIRQPLASSLLASDLKTYKNKIIEIVGYYVTYKPTSTKKGERMMFGCFLDQKGFFFDTNHFPEATRKFPFHGKGCYLIKGKVAEEFDFYSINVLEMHRIDYVMFEEDAESRARSRPDPVITPPVVPASKEFRYKLVIEPPPHVTREIMILKKRVHKHFDHYQAMVSQPNIMLCHFTESEMKEGELLKQISMVAHGQSSFRISLEDFDILSSHSLSIKILNGDSILGIVQELRQKLDVPRKTAKFSRLPYIEIAGSLEQSKLSRLSAEFCEQKYSVSFIANHLTLFKKEIRDQFGKYQLVKEFMMEGKAAIKAKRFV